MVHLIYPAFGRTAAPSGCGWPGKRLLCLQGLRLGRDHWEVAPNILGSGELLLFPATQVRPCLYRTWTFRSTTKRNSYRILDINHISAAANCRIGGPGMGDAAGHKKEKNFCACQATVTYEVAGFAPLPGTRPHRTLVDHFRSARRSCTITFDRVRRAAATAETGCYQV
jgi:hypothetical protein